jgi:membrane protein
VDRTSRRKDSQAGLKAGGRRVGREIGVGKEKIVGSLAGYLWHPAGRGGFHDQAMTVARTLLLCAFPFFLIVAALTGRSAVQSLARRLGPSQQAAADVGYLFTSSATTAAAVTGLAWAAFIFCGICASSAVKGLYERVFELRFPGSPGHDPPADLAGPGGGLFPLERLGGALGAPRRPGPVRDRRSGRIHRRVVVHDPVSAGRTGRMAETVSVRRRHGPVLLGMMAVFSATFSGMVISGAQKYGPIGTVFALMSWMIAIGVVIILGAVTGLVWQERGLSFRAAFRKVRRPR